MELSEFTLETTPSKELSLNTARTQDVSPDPFNSLFDTEESTSRPLPCSPSPRKFPTHAEQVIQQELEQLASSSSSSPVTLEQNLSLVLIDCLKHHLFALTENLLLRGVSNVRPNAEFKAYRGKTALHFAVETGKLELCELLITYGQMNSLDHQDEDGMTPLHCACALDCTNIAKSLLRNGASISLQDQLGNIPFHYIVLQKNQDLCKFFLRRDADLTIVNNGGDSPLDLAVHNGFTEVLCLMNVAPRASRPPMKEVDDEVESPSQSEGEELEELGEVEVSQFEILRSLKKLSSGEMVYLVKHSGSSRLFTMKVAKLSRLHNKNLYLKLFNTELQVLSTVNHPFISKLVYSHEDEQFLYLVQEHYSGGDLAKLLAKRKSLTEEEARLLIAQVILAIETLHNHNILYRNLKPKHVELDTSGFVKLTDFTLAKVEVCRATNSFFLSATRLPPEMIKSEGHGYPADWYMVGALLYELVIGKPPFFSSNKNMMTDNILKKCVSIPSYVSEDLRFLLLQLLDKNPTNRLSSAEEIKKHRFFEGMNWEDVLAGRVPQSDALINDVSLLSVTEEVYSQSFLALSSICSLSVSKIIE